MASSLYKSVVKAFSGSENHEYTRIPHYGATTDGLQTLASDATKIEPKVWLASERTYLSWLRVSVTISTFALALFNAGNDRLAQWMGFIYAMIAGGILIYAWIMQDVRRDRIISRFAGDHDDLYGPLVICGALFLAVVVNFILRVQQREHLRDVPSPKNPWTTTVDLVIQALSFQ